MTTPTETEGLSIDFAAIAGEDKSSPKGAADNVLERVDLTQPLEKFSCRDSLNEAQRGNLHQVALGVADGFKQDRTKLSSFGDTALDDLNQTVTHILEQQGNLRIPEVERITKEMSKTVADFRRKYKNSDPRLLNALEKFADSIAGIFKAGRQFFDELYIDSQTAVKRLDGVAAQLVKNKFALDRNVLLCDELYAKNEKSMVTLIGVIAIQEEVLEILGTEAQQAKTYIDSLPKGQSVARRDKEEALTTLLELIQELESRRSEFVSRLFVAWSTAPQIRNLRKVSNSLSQRLHLLVVLTIPTMKLTIAQWGMLLQIEEAGKATLAVSEANNDALQEYALATGEAIPRLALLAETPSITPATIIALADSVEAQNEGIITAVKEGQRLRAELDSTVVKAVRTMNASGEKTQRELISLLTQAKQPIALEASPEIPEAVLEYDQQQNAA